METQNQLFALICGRVHCFLVDGTPLPVCQRCLGLYLGTLLTAAWLAAGGHWRRGLPSRSVALVDLGALIAAGLGGLHIVDGGETWRVAGGLWTGHVLTLWLASAIGQLLALSRPAGGAGLSWGTADKLQAVAFVLLVPVIAVALPSLLPLSWLFWSATAAIGAVLLAALIVVGLAVSGRYAFESMRAPILRVARRPR